jgi:hypothetical protein
LRRTTPLALCIAASLLLAALLGACAGAPVQCPEAESSCASAFSDCEPAPQGCVALPPGVSYGLVTIDASPTPASIYVDGRAVGRTPLRHPLSFTDQTRYVIVVAEPLYPHQTRQERRIRVPPLPERIQFFMNNPAEADDADSPRP